MPHEIIETAQAPKAIGPYSQAVRAGETTWLSGQIALNPATGELEGPGDIEAQTHQVMKNLLAVLEAAGHRPTDLVRGPPFTS
jgi:2-iminobutanoate/2-iminopropanoate deaminase